MRQKVIGIYCLGAEQVELVLREGDGGEFYSKPEKGKVARIKIGAGDGDNWHRLAAVLNHEAMELVMFHMGFRYSATPDYANDNGAYLFVMTHTQFSEAVARSAMFMADALPDLATAWNKWRKRK